MIRLDTFFGHFQVRVTKVMRWSAMATPSVPAEDTKLRLDIRKRSMMVYTSRGGDSCWGS